MVVSTSTPPVGVRPAISFEMLKAGQALVDVRREHRRREEAITPIKQFSTTASSSRPAKIRPVVAVDHNEGRDRQGNSATLQSG